MCIIYIVLIRSLIVEVKKYFLIRKPEIWMAHFMSWWQVPVSRFLTFDTISAPCPAILQDLNWQLYSEAMSFVNIAKSFSQFTVRLFSFHHCNRSHQQPPVPRWHSQRRERMTQPLCWQKYWALRRASLKHLQVMVIDKYITCVPGESEVTQQSA